MTTYTAGDPRQQPLLMQVLKARLLVASAPQWSAEQCRGWADEIDALIAPYQAAIEAHRPAEAAMMVADAGFRSAIRSGQARLAAFKRDLQNLGLTETQIHDSSRTPRPRQAGARTSPPPPRNGKGRWNEPLRLPVYRPPARNFGGRQHTPGSAHQTGGVAFRSPRTGGDSWRVE